MISLKIHFYSNVSGDFQAKVKSMTQIFWNLTF